MTIIHDMHECDVGVAFSVFIIILVALHSGPLEQKANDFCASTPGWGCIG